MALIDTHCHLDYEAFDSDRSEVLRRAQEAGVEMIVAPGTSTTSSAASAALSAQHAAVYAAVGVHPNDTAAWTPQSIAQLRELAAKPKVVAIGEIGLDYYWDKAPKDVQKKALQAQLELAAEMELPVIVHNRESNDDLLAMLLEWQQGLQAAGSPLAGRPGVLHSFSGDRQMAEKALAAGYFLGFTGPLTFKNAPELQALAADVPLDRILVETDSPFLSPHPLRGQRNEPARVKLVAEKLAALKALGFDEVAAATTANAERLFRFQAAQ
jgi:TatD DNase family protein